MVHFRMFHAGFGRLGAHGVRIGAFVGRLGAGLPSCRCFPLVIPAEAVSWSSSVLALSLLRAGASTPPAEERVTLFFTRVKKESPEKKARGLRSRRSCLLKLKGCAGPTYVFFEAA
jgi:hypothetical protein